VTVNRYKTKINALNSQLECDFSDNVPVYFFIHLKGQLMQFALRNEIQERILARTLLSKFTFLSEIACIKMTVIMPVILFGKNINCKLH